MLVIGGGGTGLAAAMSAMDNGAKDVMVVEKLSRFGGSTSVSGAVVAAENTYYTQSIGLEPNSEVWLEEWKASSDSDIVRTNMRCWTPILSGWPKIPC